MVWLVRTCNGFPEIFLIGEILQMPLVIPSRYESRALLHTRDVHGIPIFHVDSAAFSKPVLTNAESITHNGVWVVPADARAAGSLPDFGIRERRCVFGIHILYTEEFLAAVCAHFPSAAALPTHVLYHGTAAEAWEGICASGLEPTFGMLGTGVYMGTFWKATRFAALTQSYQPRKDGIILRAYVHAPRLYTFDDMLFRPAYDCPCARCTAAKESGDSAQIERAAYTDHETRWALCPEVCGAEVLPQRCKSEPTLWILKNAEWCLRPQCIHVQLGARLDLKTMEDAHYDPLKRSQKIL
jgi:hypothetical protein